MRTLDYQLDLNKLGSRQASSISFLSNITLNYTDLRPFSGWSICEDSDVQQIKSVEPASKPGLDLNGIECIVDGLLNITLCCVFFN